MLAAVALLVSFGLSLSLLWAAVALAVRDPADPAASADDGKPEGVHSPVHTLAITVMRMPLLDNLDLEPLSAACAEASRAEFMLARDTAERPRRDGAARRSRTRPAAPPRRYLPSWLVSGTNGPIPSLSTTSTSQTPPPLCKRRESKATVHPSTSARATATHLPSSASTTIITKQPRFPNRFPNRAGRSSMNSTVPFLPGPPADMSRPSTSPLP